MCWRRPLQAVACWRLTEDFIADYQQRLPSLPVRSSVQPGYLRPRLPETAPEQPQGLPDILAHVDAHIMPGITHWQHPAFFGWFSANSSAPAMLADMLCNALGVIGFSWIASPAATELEAVGGWLEGGRRGD